jgi:hypothetical protein
MFAGTMQPGLQYRIENERKKVVELSHFTDKWAIVHERGDLDMQSMWGIALTQPVSLIAEEAVHCCPSCFKPVLIVNNPHNPVCRRYTYYCACGWMGR